MPPIGRSEFCVVDAVGRFFDCGGARHATSRFVPGSCAQMDGVSSTDSTRVSSTLHVAAGHTHTVSGSGGISPWRRRRALACPAGQPWQPLDRPAPPPLPAAAPSRPDSETRIRQGRCVSRVGHRIHIRYGYVWDMAGIRIHSVSRIPSYLGWKLTNGNVSAQSTRYGPAQLADSPTRRPDRPPTGDQPPPSLATRSPRDGDEELHPASNNEPPHPTTVTKSCAWRWGGRAAAAGDGENELRPPRFAAGEGGARERHRPAPLDRKSRPPVGPPRPPEMGRTSRSRRRWGG
ncbi:hypothetical protein PVAP13_4KG374801 [Panicum virgatum]|uniref:Uncharacterized protein n=1 Tax=Panicum virgatum TaxID=38727 RepID=A0A8T0TTP8_PANVG|nr:hypothetical protein PVAP13_4KG374801 [Panicum virgatum]